MNVNNGSPLSFPCVAFTARARFSGDMVGEAATEVTGLLLLLLCLLSPLSFLTPLSFLSPLALSESLLIKRGGLE